MNDWATPGDLLVIVPSRGRPDNARELLDTFHDTASLAVCCFVTDDDDPELEGYQGIPNLVTGPRLRMCPSLSAVAVAATSQYRNIGFAGDDHRFRTRGWDRTIINALDGMGTGIVYGNDLFQGPNLPTAVFMTSNIVQTLGYMVPPGLVHLFADNAWKTWGEGIGRLRYLPDVIIEHLHPQAGKGDWDDRYAEVNSGAMWEHDQKEWELYKAQCLATDVAKLKALL